MLFQQDCGLWMVLCFEARSWNWTRFYSGKIDPEKNYCVEPQQNGRIFGEDVERLDITLTQNTYLRWMWSFTVITSGIVGKRVH